MNYYEILNISKSATQSEIKRNHRNLIKKYHPDLYHGNKAYAEEMTKKINEAYEVLKDPLKKKEYDTRLNNNYSQNNREKYNNQHSSKQYKSYANKEYIKISQDSKEKTNNILIKLSIDCISKQKTLFFQKDVNQYELEINLLIINILIFYIMEASSEKKENLLKDFSIYLNFFNNYIIFYNKLIAEINNFNYEFLKYTKDKSIKNISPILYEMIKILFINYSSYIFNPEVIDCCMASIIILLDAKENFTKYNTQTTSSNDKKYTTSSNKNNTQNYKNINDTFNNFINIVKEQKLCISNNYTISINYLSSKLLILNLILIFENYIQQYDSMTLLNTEIRNYLYSESLEKDFYKEYIYYLNKYLIYDSKNKKNESMPANLYIALNILYSTEKINLQTATNLCKDLILIFKKFLKID